jgi:3-hydroxy-9,10-secoandrosta-1,3,5(10)-triene-9,17-dione monooxygenase reductase component
MTVPTDLTPRRLRNVLGQFATGLTVITANTPSGPAGFTCQSFVSLSLEPPLISFNPTRTSNTWPVLRQIGSFTVNVLSAELENLSGQFGRSGTDKFAGVGYHLSPLGHPVLDNGLAWIDCELVQEYDGGDHTIVVAAVRSLQSTHDGEPLVFHRGRYVRLQPGPEAAVAATSGVLTAQAPSPASGAVA